MAGSSSLLLHLLVLLCVVAICIHMLDKRPLPCAASGSVTQDALLAQKQTGGCHQGSLHGPAPSASTALLSDLLALGLPFL